MKKLIISICLLMSALILKSQTFTSDQINIWKPTKYIIKKEKKGIHKVYKGDWELVAIMDRHGEAILFAKNKTQFRLQKNANWFRHLRRSYVNKKGEQVVYTTIKHRVYVVNTTIKKNEQTDLLIALSLHQLMELQARDKAKMAQLYLLDN